MCHQVNRHSCHHKCWHIVFPMNLSVFFATNFFLRFISKCLSYTMDTKDIFAYNIVHCRVDSSSRYMCVKLTLNSDRITVGNTLLSHIIQHHVINENIAHPFSLVHNKLTRLSVEKHLHT